MVIFFRTTRELEYLFYFSRKARNFFQYLTLDYMTNTLNQIICFYLHQSQNIFSATLGIRIFFQKKTIAPPRKLNGPSLMNDTDVERTSVLGFKFTKCFDQQRFVFLIVVKLTEEIMFNQREKIVDVWYLGTNQNEIIFELLTAIHI